MAEVIDLDLRTITLGEMAEAEASSGRDFTTLVKGRANVMMLALFLREYRASGKPPSWNELGSRRLLDDSSSTSPSVPDGDHPR